MAKSYGDVRAVESLSLRVPAGQVVAHRAMRRSLPALGALVMGLTACSSETPSQAPAPEKAKPVANGSSGCGKASSGSGRFRFGGREYALTLPSYDGRTLVPLVLDLHGLRAKLMHSSTSTDRTMTTGPQIWVRRANGTAAPFIDQQRGVFPGGA
ncbi:hypothetical protein [Streptosporangium subroseum]|uniref:hypothetical protein n=1 Tax=Streptosporangium subroseum TaxID=106412 RepID=UPI00308E1D90|nr:hypothetical protein OHB15_48160 [Streptosporangium subroseum]